MWYFCAGRLIKLTLRRVCILLCNKCLLGAETHCIWYMLLRPKSRSCYFRGFDANRENREKKVTAEKNPYTVFESHGGGDQSISFNREGFQKGNREKEG